MLRACNQYQVTVGAGEQGQAWANALLSAQVGASTKLRRARFKQKVTTRLAVGLAGAYWGTQEKHARNGCRAGRVRAGDKVEQGGCRAEATSWRTGRGVLDAKTMCGPLSTGVNGGRCAHTHWNLLEWHQAEPHKWPLTVLMDVWEKLHWRFFEEL